MIDPEGLAYPGQYRKGRIAIRPCINMKFDPGKLHRHSIRLRGYDYSQPGAYSVTLVTRQRENLFGEITSGEMNLNICGRIVDDTWVWLGTRYPYIEPGDRVVMPNHFHGILIIHEDARRGGSAVNR